MQTDESGLTLLSVATLQGQTEQLKILIPSARFFILLHTGDLEIVQWLIESYPQVGEIPNANGDLAVHFAAAEGACVPSNNGHAALILQY